jgi:hypothetical protein
MALASAATALVRSSERRADATVEIAASAARVELRRRGERDTRTTEKHYPYQDRTR